LNITVTKNSYEFNSKKEGFNHLQFVNEKVAEIAINKNAFKDYIQQDKLILKASIRTVSDGNELFYPRQGDIEMIL
jgi:thiaminase